MTSNLHDIIPKWASGYACGNYMQKGAQLSTKDGRKIGNAVVVGFSEEILEQACDGEWGYVPETAHVITDFGNRLRLSLIELEQLYYPPKWVMKWEEVKEHYL
jgi:hypothetical protein